MTEVACVDLFCGAGGLTHGLKRTGINVVAGIDIDNYCKHPFEKNNDAKFLLEDVSSISPSILSSFFGSAKYRILAGCAPCQPFSTYSQRYETIGTERWGLMYHFSRLIKSIKPEIVVMENVPSVLRHQVYTDFVEKLQKSGYYVTNQINECKKYGLPQRRKRMVLLAALDRPIELIEPPKLKEKSVYDAIGLMPKLNHGETSKNDRLHMSASLSDLNLKRIRASKQGGTWRDWPKELIAECHKKETGRSYPSVYARMKWNEPSPTLTTQFFGFGNGRFGHPEQDRAITLREGSILQGFPTNYSFIANESKVHIKALGRLIGNAVPVTLGEVIGKSIQQHIKITQKENASLDEKFFPINKPFQHSDLALNSITSFTQDNKKLA